MGFSACKGNGPTTVKQHINRHIIRIAFRHPASLGPLSSLAGCQPRALEVAGSNPAGPIDILGYKKKRKYRHDDCSRVKANPY